MTQGGAHPWNRMVRICGFSCTKRTPGPSALLSMRNMHPHTCTGRAGAYTDRTIAGQLTSMCMSQPQECCCKSIRNSTVRTAQQVLQAAS